MATAGQYGVAGFKMTIHVFFISVPQEEDSFQPESHPPVGSVCNGADSSR